MESDFIPQWKSALQNKVVFDAECFQNDSTSTKMHFDPDAIVAIFRWTVETKAWKIYEEICSC